MAIFWHWAQGVPLAEWPTQRAEVGGGRGLSRGRRLRVGQAGSAVLGEEAGGQKQSSVPGRASKGRGCRGPARVGMEGKAGLLDLSFLVILSVTSLGLMMSVEN